MQQHKGFTLIELMIVVAIIGILSAIAYPAYMEHVQSTRRADARATLLALSSAMERFYTINYSYTGSQNGLVPAPPVAALATPSTSPAGSNSPSYNMLITSAAGTTYMIEARRTGPHINDPCGDFTLNQAGIQGLNNNALSVQDCW